MTSRAKRGRPVALRLAVLSLVPPVHLSLNPKFLLVAKLTSCMAAAVVFVGE